MKAATLFSGFDGAGIGIKAAGFEIAWGLELVDEIAAVARANGHPVITGDILQADPHNFERVDALHASPPCQRASLANSSAEENEEGLKESQLDIDLAMKTVEFIEVLRPRIVTIENVWGYRKFQAFKGGKKCEGILPVLERLGYWINVQHVNSADFGVPQTRRRLILRAVLGGWVPQLPEPEPWVGWYEAIEDLIPTLPESQFAPWQLERLPAELKDFMVAGGNTNMNDAQPGRGVFYKAEPAPTVPSDISTTRYRAFLVSPIDGLQRSGHEPAQTVVSSAKTVEPRALIFSQDYGSPNTVDDRKLNTKSESEPVFTIKAQDRPIRAFFAAGGNATHDNCARLDNEPSWTVGDVNRVGNIPRAWLSQGRVVKMTPRALARFQSFPDSYELPDNNALACKGIGNACPPLLFEKLYRQLEEP